MRVQSLLCILQQTNQEYEVITIFLVLKVRYNVTMLSLTSGSISASTCFEAFLQVAATTIGVVAAFALYVLVLVTWSVTKFVSNVLICVGDFLDMLGDELIVCMYEKADHIIMPSQPEYCS